MNSKEIYCALSVLLTLVGFYPYITSIFKGQTKPHVLSWVIWSISTLVVFFAQLAEGGGVGAWPTLLSGLITTYVAVLAFLRRTEIVITLSDWFFFILALISIPLWYVTSNPLFAVLILTTVDVFGFVPTFRKGYHKPYDENLLFYFIFALRSFASVLALENFSLSTILFPAAIGAMSFAMIPLLVYRRKSVVL
jgi:hypothetical protein